MADLHYHKFTTERTLRQRPHHENEIMQVNNMSIDQIM